MTTLIGTRCRRSATLAALLLGGFLTVAVCAEESSDRRAYDNRLVPIVDPKPLLNDYPQWVQPITEACRYEAPALVDDPNADLSVRAWRFCYNARGIIEIPNHLAGKATALVVVHPWGLDDGQGWKTPKPAGCAMFCTPQKNRLGQQHVREVLNPLIQSLRSRVNTVLYSEPGKADPIRMGLYRTIHGTPSEPERTKARQQLTDLLGGFHYEAGDLPRQLTLSQDLPVVDYFQQFRGLDPGDHYNGPGFWSLPIPVVSAIQLAPNDVVVFDGDGYPPLRDFLRAQAVRHVLLTGYCTDMCVKATTAGYDNLRKDFNVFLVGDATLATFPAAEDPATATSAALSLASLDLLITQISWINPLKRRCAAHNRR